MCPQIKAKNYDKVEKVSICYRMEATFWIYWLSEIIVMDIHRCKSIKAELYLSHHSKAQGE